MEVLLEGPWAGALARVTSGKGASGRSAWWPWPTIALHLEAIALAAGALLLAGGGVPPGACRPRDVGSAYLAACLGVGLEVAGLGERVHPARGGGRLAHP